MQHDAWVGFARFSPDGTMIVTGSWDNKGRLWDASGHAIGEPIEHRGRVDLGRFL